jgi:UDP-glucose 4-epimerase
MTKQYQWAAKRVLVTGGAGFIGSHLVEELLAAGAMVTVIDQCITGSLANLIQLSKIDFRELDINQVSWENLLSEQDFQLVFHLAGSAYVPFSVENPSADLDINLECSFRLLEALRRIEWPGVLVYPSSAAVYGNPIRMPICEDDPTVPISPYGVSKLAVERYISVYSQLYGIKAASLRPFSVYGPRQRKLVVYDFIEKILKNPKELLIYGDGSQTRDFIYVEDVVRAMMLVAERGRLEGEVYNVASGQSVSIRELAESLCCILKIQPKFVYSGSVRPGEPEKWSVDISRLAALGYQPQVSLEQGLRGTVEWYQRTPVERSV